MAPTAAAVARWVKPEVYPLVGMMSMALGFMAYTSVRSLTSAPDVFVTKARRQEGGPACTEVEGRVYRHSPLREFVRSFYDIRSTSNPLTPAGKH